MAHGDAQRRGGELGPAGTRLTEQIAEDAGGNAVDLTVDDTAFTVFAGTDAQSVLESADVVADDYETRIDTLETAEAPAGGATLDFKAADQALTGAAAAAFTTALEASSFYAYRAVLAFTGLAVGDSLTLSSTGPGGLVVRGSVFITDYDGAVVKQTDQNGGISGTIVVGATGVVDVVVDIFLIPGVTAGNLVLKIEASTAVGNLKKGSFVSYQKG